MTTKYNLRPLNVNTDLPALATLMNAIALEQANRRTITEETLHEFKLKRLPDEIVCDLAAISDTGNLVGFGQAGRRDYHSPGAFWVKVLVAPASRRQGVGTQLYNALEAWAKINGATRLSAEVRDDCASGHAFADKRGYALDRHSFSSTLSIPDFDDSGFAGTIEKLEAEGLRFFSLADVDSDAARRKLYELNTVTGLDVPGSSPDSIRPYEAFAADVFNGYWFRPDGQLFASDGEKWVGMCAVGEMSPGVMSNMMTGVLPEYRGRGIALALKLQAVAFCRKHGASVMQTGNDSTNAPMLAVNRKMGYRPTPGVYHLSKALS